jgi:putative endonuclease
MQLRSTPTNVLGRMGESRALEHLQFLGWEVLEQNWRNRRNEVDMIALDGETVVFVEVKYRSGPMQMAEEDVVSRGQERRIMNAARAYLAEQKLHDCEVRFDLLLVLGGEDGHRLEHYQSAFHPNVSLGRWPTA